LTFARAIVADAVPAAAAAAEAAAEEEEVVVVVVTVAAADVEGDLDTPWINKRRSTCRVLQG